MTLVVRSGQRRYVALSRPTVVRVLLAAELAGMVRVHRPVRNRTNRWALAR